MRREVSYLLAGVLIIFCFALFAGTASAYSKLYLPNSTGVEAWREGNISSRSLFLWNEVNEFNYSNTDKNVISSNGQYFVSANLYASGFMPIKAGHLIKFKISETPLEFPPLKMKIRALHQHICDMACGITKTKTDTMAIYIGNVKTKTWKALNSSYINSYVAVGPNETTKLMQEGIIKSDDINNYVTANGEVYLLVFVNGTSGNGGAGGSSTSKLFYADLEMTDAEELTCTDSDEGNFPETFGGVSGGNLSEEYGYEGSDTIVTSSTTAQIYINKWINATLGGTVYFDFGKGIVFFIDFYGLGDSRNRVGIRYTYLKDYCGNTNQLLEAVCTPSGRRMADYIRHDCAYGCLDGACLPNSTDDGNETTIPKADLFMSLATLKDDYNVTEQINLTDPPEEGNNVLENANEVVDINNRRALNANRQGEYIIDNNLQQMVASEGIFLNGSRNIAKPEHNGWIIQLKEKPLVVEKVELEKRAKENKKYVDASAWYNPVKYAYALFATMPNDVPRKIESHRKVLDDEHARVKSSIKDKLAKGTGITGNAISENTGELKIMNEFKGIFNGFSLNISDSEAKEIEKIEGVERVSPNLKVEATLMDSVLLINADDVWRMDKDGNNCIESGGECLTGKNVTIAIIDTGVDYTHEDLGQTIRNEREFNKVTSNPLKTLFSSRFSYDDDQQFKINNNRLVYFSQNKIYIYSFQTEQTEEIVLPSVDLQVIRLAFENNRIAYFAVNLVTRDLGVYVYDLTTNVHERIYRDDLYEDKGIGFIGLSGDNVIYDLSFYDGNSWIHNTYVYNISSRTNDEILKGSIDFTPHTLVSGNMVAYSFSSGHCYDKIILYNLDTKSQTDIFPPDVGPVLDFEGDSLVYVDCSKIDFDNQWRHYHIYNITSGESIPISSIEEQIDGLDSNSFSSLYVQSWINKASIGNGVVYFSKSVSTSPLMIYDRNYNKYGQLNVKLTSGAVDAEGNKVCFLSSDMNIYCHSYDINGNYSIPKGGFNSKVIGGYDFVNDDNDPMDDHGHGTHVAATAAGKAIESNITSTPASALIRPAGDGSRSQWDCVDSSEGCKIGKFAVINESVIQPSLTDSSSYITTPSIYAPRIQEIKMSDIGDMSSIQQIKVWLYGSTSGIGTIKGVNVSLNIANEQRSSQLILPISFTPSWNSVTFTGNWDVRNLRDISVQIESTWDGIHFTGNYNVYTIYAEVNGTKSRGGSGSGLNGVAPDAKILAYKVLSSIGRGSFDNIIAAIERAVNDGADIISMSLGGSGDPDDPLSQAVDNAVDAGVVNVIAAGNCGPGGNPASCPKLGDETIGSPGTARKAITVGATYKKNYNGSYGLDVNPRVDQITSFSSRGPVLSDSFGLIKPDIVAPGAIICAAEWGSAWSGRRCLDDKHVEISGTSMATPHVAGAVALIKQAHPDWSPEEIKNSLKSSAIDLGYPSIVQGSGRIDVYKVAELTVPINNYWDLFAYPNFTIANIHDNLQIKGIFPEDYTSIKVEYRKEGEINWRTSGLTIIGEGGIAAEFNPEGNILDTGNYEFKITLTYKGETKTSANKVYFDKDLKSGWPIKLQSIDNFGTLTEPLVLDVNNDGIKDLIFIDPYYRSERWFAFDQYGNKISGWPKDLGYPNPVVTDINDDGNLEIIGSSYSKLNIYNSNGDLINSYSMQRNGWVDQIVVDDMDKDGRKEIIFSAYSSNNYSDLYIIDGEMNLVRYWPDLGSYDNFMATGDLDNDGKKEIVISYYQNRQEYSDPIINVLSLSGDSISGWPKQSGGFTNQPILVDTNEDNNLEILYTDGYLLYYKEPPGYRDQDSNQVKLNLWDYNGNHISGWPVFNVYMQSPAIGDINTDGKVEFFGGERRGPIGWPLTLFGYNVNGIPVSGWPKESSIYGSSIVLDIDGDGYQNIITSNLNSLFVFDSSGKIVDEYTKIVDGNINSFGINDIDGDGLIELFITSGYPNSFSNFYVFDFKTPYNPSAMDWPMFQHDAQHTGCYDCFEDKRPQSKIVNNGDMAVTGQLNLELQKNVSGEWQTVRNVVNKSLSINAWEVVKLDKIWNPNNVNIVSGGRYRVNGEFVYSDGMVNASWEFNMNGTNVNGTNVILNLPMDGSFGNKSSYAFNASFSSPSGLSYANLYIWNSSGSVVVKSPNVPLGGNSMDIAVGAGLPSQGTFYWNYEVTDKDGRKAFADKNFSVEYKIVCPSGIVGYWPFDINADDVSVNKYNAALYSTLFDSGKIGKALKFAGTIASKGILPNKVIDNRSDVTVAFWMKTTGSGDGIFSVARTGYYSNEILITNAESLAYFVHNSQKSLVKKTNDNNWHFVVLSSSHNAGKVNATAYIDGVSINNRVFSTSFKTFNALGIVLGQDQDKVLGGFERAQAYNGLMDELVVYDKVLSMDEVNALWNKGQGKRACE